MTDNSELEDLKREVEALKKAVKPEPPIDWDRLVAEHRDKVHQMNERRMNRAYAWSREEIEAMDKASGGRSAVQGHGGLQNPSGLIPTSPNTAASSAAVPPNRTGWAKEQPLRPPYGVPEADKLMDHQDALDKAERIKSEAQLQAMRKAADAK
jgi:hypothetical protein